MSDIVIIDYKHGNLKSIQRSFKEIGKKIIQFDYSPRTSSTKIKQMVLDQSKQKYN